MVIDAEAFFNELQMLKDNGINWEGRVFISDRAQLILPRYRQMDHLPRLLNHYASLMQYRRLAQAFREAHGLRDPHPASVLLSDDAPTIFPPPLRARLAAARADAKALLATSAGRTMKDLRQALARREWRRTG